MKSTYIKILFFTFLGLSTLGIFLFSHPSTIKAQDSVCTKVLIKFNESMANTFATLEECTYSSKGNSTSNPVLIEAGAKCTFNYCKCTSGADLNKIISSPNECSGDSNCTATTNRLNGCACGNFAQCKSRYCNMTTQTCADEGVTCSTAGQKPVNTGLACCDGTTVDSTGTCKSISSCTYAKNRPNGCTCEGNTQCTSGFCREYAAGNKCADVGSCSSAGQKPTDTGAACCYGTAVDSVGICKSTSTSCSTLTGKINGCTCEANSQCQSGFCKTAYQGSSLSQFCAPASEASCSSAGQKPTTTGYACCPGTTVDSAGTCKTIQTTPAGECQKNGTTCASNARPVQTVKCQAMAANNYNQYTGYECQLVNKCYTTANNCAAAGELICSQSPPYTSYSECICKTSKSRAVGCDCTSDGQCQTNYCNGGFCRPSTEKTGDTGKTIGDVGDDTTQIVDGACQINLPNGVWGCLEIVSGPCNVFMAVEKKGPDADNWCGTSVKYKDFTANAGEVLCPGSMGISCGHCVQLDIGDIGGSQAYTGNCNETPTYQCNSTCTEVSNCSNVDSKMTCFTSTDGSKNCRLIANTSSATCQPEKTAPQCLSISMTNATTGVSAATADPTLGDNVTFTCGAVTGAAKYIFRVIDPDGVITPLTATGRTSQQFTITKSGEYNAQCQICTTTNDSSCYVYEPY